MHYLNRVRDKTGNLPLIITGAAGVIIKNNKILLVFHKKRNLWQIPGGLQEYGESLEKTVEREIEEELNLVLKADKLIYLQSDPKWGWEFDDGFHFHPITALFYMNGNVDEDKINIQKDEILKYNFFNLNEIPTNIFECCKDKVYYINLFLKDRNTE